MPRPITVGAVLYDPKVAVIWEIIREFFEQNGCPMNVVFYTNYELQVEALASGGIDIAWNSPLAWLDASRHTTGDCRAIAMRDTDRDRVSHIVVRRADRIESLQQLRRKTVAVGAKDSPQSTLIPIAYLQKAGLEPGRDFQVRRYDVLVGKHGDHVGGELEAFRSLERRDSEACTMLDLNWDTWTQDGTINLNEYDILATTDRFDHCVFTVRRDLDEGLERRWLEVLFSMSYDKREHREMMDLEGLKEWLPGRTTGFGPLTDAVERQCYFQEVTG